MSGDDKQERPTFKAISLSANTPDELLAALDKAPEPPALLQGAPADPGKCQHLAHQVSAHIHRSVVREKLQFVLEIQCWCQDCGASFAFEDEETRRFLIVTAQG
jgi:hypothetical protein